MKKKLCIASRATLLGAALLTPAWAFAQTVQPEAKEAPVPEKPIPVESTEATVPEDDDILVLTPFEVSASNDKDPYQVKETLAGTRVRTKLRDLGSAISVVNSKFMSDISATNAQSLLQYTTNNEVGGIFGNFGGVGDGSVVSENARLLQPNNQTRVRGLAAADNTRNYFISSIPWDSFNIDRVDMARGANSMLFGAGSPAGIINQSLNEAMYTNQNKFVNRMDEYGSQRNVLDVNYVLIPNEFAVRVVGLDDNEKYQQEGTFNHTKRVYGALRYNPSWMKFPGSQMTIKINNEYGSGKSRNPRVLPPVDRITPWFNDLNKLTLDPYVARKADGVAGGPNSPNFNPYLNSVMGRLFWSNIMQVFTDTNSSQATGLQNWNVNQGVRYAIGRPNPTGGLPTDSNWTVTGAIAGIPYAQPVAISSYRQYATDADLPGSQYGLYKDKLLTDTSIFDFYEKTLDGPNTHQWQRWNGFNADINQTFLDGRLGWNASYYAEKYINGGQNYLTDQAYAISVDIQTVLPDGSPNPNVGRPYVSTDGVYGNNETISDNEAWRGTIYGELRATDFTSSKLMQQIIGRHVITAVGSQDKYDADSKSWARWNATNDWMNLVGNAPSLTGGSRNVNMVSYIGGDLRNSTLAGGLNLNGINTFQLPGKSTSVRYFDSHWKYSLNPSDPTFVDPNAAYTLPLQYLRDGTLPTSDDALSNQSQNPANYVGWTNANVALYNADQGDRNHLYIGGAKSQRIVRSKAVTWQGYLFGEKLVTAMGWRKDEVTLASATAPFIDQASGLVNPFSYSSGPIQRRQEDQTRTWSLVYHMPDVVKKALPLGLDLSLFYSKGENFRAQGVRVDYLGNTIGNEQGETTEKGFIISALDGKVSLKANWYESKMKNSSLTGAVNFPAPWELYLLPTWGAAHAAQKYAGLNNLTINGVATPPWFWDWASGDGVAGVGYGQMPRPPEAAASDAAEMAAINAFATNAMSQQFYDLYELPVNVAAMQSGDWTHAITRTDDWIAGQNGGGGLQSASAGTIGGISPSITMDTLSKGVELELYAQPTKNWNITINAAKNTSTQQNFNKTLVDLIMMQKRLWDSDAGNLRQWSRGGTTFRTVFYRDIYGPYQTLLALENRQVPELRPWRVNTITNYSFSSGALKGFGVGGAYRWEQGATLGYRIDPTTELIDVDQPIKGPSEANFDLWFSYNRKFSQKIDWTVQLNIRNVGRKAHLVPISVQPDGSPAAARIATGQLVQLTNTFKF